MSKLTAFFKLGKLFWNNGEHIFTLLDVLDDRLPHVGVALENAGQMALVAGQVIKGGSGLPPGAVELIEDASDAIGATGNKITSFANRIDSINEKLYDINLPTVTIENQSYPVLGGIGSVTIPTPKKEDWHPFQEIETLLDAQVTVLEDAATQLDTSSEKLHNLSGSLTNTANQLTQLGSKLKEAGGLLKEIGA